MPILLDMLVYSLAVPWFALYFAAWVLRFKCQVGSFLCGNPRSLKGDSMPTNVIQPLSHGDFGRQRRSLQYNRPWYSGEHRRVSEPCTQSLPHEVGDNISRWLSDQPRFQNNGAEAQELASREIRVESFPIEIPCAQRSDSLHNSNIASRKHKKQRTHKRKRNKTQTKPYGKARYPCYQTKASRLETFKTWPIPDEIDPSELASAGFFYENEGDRVRCFVCGCVLYNWSPEFRPQKEHNGWFPKCRFANLLITNSKALIEVQELPAVKAVVDLSYSPTKVERAYEKAVESGHESPHASDLLETIWAMGDCSSSDYYSSDEDEDNCTNSEEEDLYSAQASLPQKKLRDEQESESEDEDEEAEEEEEVEVDLKKSHYNEAEGKKLRQQVEKLEELRLCRVCKTQNSDTVNLPCGHLATCQECVYKNNKCAVCNCLIQGIVRVYMV